jgi:hypothetical protein
VRLVVCACWVAVTACGRLRFDAVALVGDGGPGDAGGSASGDGPMPDAFACVGTTLHDEDGDGIVDDCDVCPHIADPAQTDTDGDRVGDACDPEPTNPRQHIVFFDPFVTIDSSWTNLGATQASDEIILDARGGISVELYRPLTATTELFMIGATTGNGDVTTHHISLVTSPMTPAGMYCEMYDDGSTTTTQFTWTFNGTTYSHAGQAGWGTTRLANGLGTFTYNYSPTTVGCSSTWDGVMRSGTGATPTGISPDYFHLYAENLLVNVQWFIQIETN